MTEGNVYTQMMQEFIEQIKKIEMDITKTIINN